MFAGSKMPLTAEPGTLVRIRMPEAQVILKKSHLM